ncbi:histone-lysine N-methyltransferase G9a isoform X1 [Rhodnius prolixus]
MTDYLENDDDLDDVLGDLSNSDNDKVDSMLIKKILSEMKCEFNRAPVIDESVKDVLGESSLISSEPKAILQVSTTQNGKSSEESCLSSEIQADVSGEPALEDTSNHTIEENIGDDNAVDNLVNSVGDNENSVLDDSLLKHNSVESSLLEPSVDRIDQENGNVTNMVSDGNELTQECLDDNKNANSGPEESTKVEINNIDLKVPEATNEHPRIVLKLRTSEDDKEGSKRKSPRISREASRLKTQSEVSEADGEFQDKRTRRTRNSERLETEVAVKRSSRRMSKEYSRESVLQNAIARKEMSFSTLDKPQRRSTRLSEEFRNNTGYRTRNRSGRLSSMNNDTSDTKKGTTPFENSVDDILSDEKRGGRNNKRVTTNSSETSLSKSSKNSSRENFNEEGVVNNYLGMTGGNFSDQDSEKGIESSSSVSSFSGVRPKRKGDGAVSLPEKRHKRSVTPQGGVETCGGAPPLNKMENSSGFFCECDVYSNLYANGECLKQNKFCRALDTFEEKLVGCCNPVDENNVVLLRPSKTVPYQQLCEIHIQRILRHNACPTCGLFCTQGTFNFCYNKHFFHKDCDLKKDQISMCPHCGTEDFAIYRLGMAPHRYPVFLPMQKPITNSLARITLCRASDFYKYQPKKEEKELTSAQLVQPTLLVLPNGNKITTEGIPTPQKEYLERLLQTPLKQADMRYSFRHLYQAAKSGDVEKVLLMLGSGMNPDGGATCALHAASAGGHLIIVHLLISAGAHKEVLDKSQYTPLMLAILNNHNEIVKYLIKAGADPQFKGIDGMTALHVAAKTGNLEACHYLVGRTTEAATYVDVVDDGRWTPLVWAAENCYTNIVRYLLGKGADPQIRDSEMNIALHWSAFAGSMEITESLIDYGSNINLSNVHGDTPLHIAARQAAAECVTLLLARGACSDMMNKAGQFPKDCVVDKSSYCYMAIDLNIKVRNIIASANIFPRILTNDVSRGREDNPIQCVNPVDEEGVPTDYTYVTENCYTSDIMVDRKISSLIPCRCDDSCSGSDCVCTNLSVRCWYDSKGKLVPDLNFSDPPMLFECNHACGCNTLTCKNRVVQKGMKVKLQLIKTKDKNWGVITLRDIPSGTYVCEYIGEIISDLEADTREDDSYLFDLDSREGESYCIDARKYGNITRFINHSCTPNLIPIRVFIGHRDLQFPRIAMFAARDIPAYEELGFDYGEKFWVIKSKLFTCKCGEETCRYSEHTIQQTLEKYHERVQMEEAAEAADI